MGDLPHCGASKLEEIMKSLMSGGLIATAVGAALAVATPAPVSAQLARPQTAVDVAGSNELVTTVQHRRHWRGGHRHHRHYGWRHRDRGWYGPALGAGFAAGALLGGALAAAPRAYYRPGVTADEIAYCSQRFKSYDPSSGTYLGYDGNRHPCP
jgi:hypothetical protein